MIHCKNANIGHKQALFLTGELVLEKGRLISLIGPNGAGKTTFYETILGQLPVLSGEIVVEGKSTNQIDRAARMKLFSHVGARFSGIEHLSVYDLIAMGRAPYTNMLHRLSTSDHEKVEMVLKQLNILHLAAKSTLEISDGERQIALIGKALAQETSILLLDEPNAFLDYNNKRKIMTLLKELAETKGMLVLLSSHDLDLSLAHSHQIIAIDQKQQAMKMFAPPYDKTEIIARIFED